VGKESASTCFRNEASRPPEKRGIGKPFEASGAAQPGAENAIAAKMIEHDSRPILANSL